MRESLRESRFRPISIQTDSVSCATTRRPARPESAASRGPRPLPAVRPERHPRFPALWKAPAARRRTLPPAQAPAPEEGRSDFGMRAEVAKNRSTAPLNAKIASAIPSAWSGLLANSGKFRPAPTVAKKNPRNNPRKGSRSASISWRYSESARSTPPKNAPNAADKPTLPATRAIPRNQQQRHGRHGLVLARPCQPTEHVFGTPLGGGQHRRQHRDAHRCTRSGKEVPPTASALARPPSPRRGSQQRQKGPAEESLRCPGTGGSRALPFPAGPPPSPRSLRAGKANAVEDIAMATPMAQRRPRTSSPKTHATTNSKAEVPTTWAPPKATSGPRRRQSSRGRSSSPIKNSMITTPNSAACASDAGIGQKPQDMGVRQSPRQAGRPSPPPGPIAKRGEPAPRWPPAETRSQAGSSRHLLAGGPGVGKIEQVFGPTQFVKIDVLVVKPGQADAHRPSPTARHRSVPAPPGHRGTRTRPSQSSPAQTSDAFVRKQIVLQGMAIAPLGTVGGAWPARRCGHHQTLSAQRRAGTPRRPNHVRAPDRSTPSGFRDWSTSTADAGTPPCGPSSTPLVRRECRSLLADTARRDRARPPTAKRARQKATRGAHASARRRDGRKTTRVRSALEGIMEAQAT
jgi:hypothetical protein